MRPLLDPLSALSRRSPLYHDRYAGKEDRFGFRIETFARWEPFFTFLFDDYFKVDVRGINHIPSEGPAILVGNHSGLLPLDGAMITVAMCNAHPSPRRVRYLATDWFFTVPGLGDWIIETGQVRATLENAEHLLMDDELVGIYPEGIRGVGKPFRERYRVLDFHPGFVRLAIATQTPLIPVATVGGDEIFPNFINMKELAQFLHMPFFPVTLGFPWLPFPLMFFPLPVRWLINIHEPIKLDYPPEKARDRKLVLSISREIQHTIQKDLNQLLRQRKSVFTGWTGDESSQANLEPRQEIRQESRQEADAHGALPGNEYRSGLATAKSASAIGDCEENLNIAESGTTIEYPVDNQDECSGENSDQMSPEAQRGEAGKKRKRKPRS